MEFDHIGGGLDVGAVQAGKNTFNTATLATQDLQNTASASAKTRGLNLSQNTLSQGKYGVAKAALGNALANSTLKQNASSTTQSAIQQAQINITNPEAQSQRTGQTPAQTIAALNTKPNKAHQPLQKMDAQVLGKRIEAQRAIKEVVFAEAIKLSDEAYRKIFHAQAFMSISIQYFPPISVQYFPLFRLAEADFFAV